MTRANDSEYGLIAYVNRERLAASAHGIGAPLRHRGGEPANRVRLPAGRFRRHRLVRPTGQRSGPVTEVFPYLKYMPRQF